ncbi:MAG: Lrp/AsnC family transcriptional regulator [Dehalococcoidia bacterium]|nr:Lrp/AsnC family transcriptional regulator [Dehalococcoidia bacterium]
MKDLLRALEQDARLSPETLARALGTTADEAKAQIAEAENDGVILGYRTIIDWDKAGEETVMAWVELRVVPQQRVGFDAISERIARFEQAVSVYLTSGTYDVGILVRGRTMHDVSNFVAETLATMEGVQSTVTHFIMRRYKVEGSLTSQRDSDERLPVSH